MTYRPPTIVRGAFHHDARGAVQHVNSFTPGKADRFYVLHPENVGEVRGWVGHRRDAKWFFAVTGCFDISVVAADAWPEPSRTQAVTRYSLDARNPAVLEVPPGHFTAIVMTEPKSALVVFSTGKIETAKEDDFRLPADYWMVPSRL